MMSPMDPQVTAGIVNPSKYTPDANELEFGVGAGRLEVEYEFQLTKAEVNRT